MRRSNGFTLIELLVVIAIIAILAAILFPVFAQAREKARAISCISNTKQVGTGMMMYTQDYDEFYPNSEYGGGSSGITQQSWASMIYPYIKNGDHDATTGQSWGVSGLYSCPSAKDQTQSFKYGVHMDLMPSNWNVKPGDPAANPSYSMAVVDSPASKVIVTEKGRNDTTWGYPYFATWEWDWTATVGSPKGSIDRSELDANVDCDYSNSDGGGTWASCSMHPRYRHTGTANMVFGDGVKAYAKGRLGWYTNIYIPGTGTAGNLKAWESQGWYPY